MWLTLLSGAAALAPNACTRGAVLRGAAAAAVAVVGRRASAIPPMDLQQKMQQLEDEAKNPGSAQPPAPLVYYTPPSVKGVSSPEALALAQHLKTKNAKMYGAYWCSHCNNQKQAFGAGGARLVQYIECAEDGYESQRSLCRKKNIEGYPTWEIGGKYVFGERSLEELAEISGFRSWPKPPAKPPPLKEGDVVPEVL